MEKLDRLGWAAGVSVSCYGVRVGIRVTDPAVLPRLIAELPPGSRARASNVVDRLYSVVAGSHSSGPGVKRYNILYADAARLVRSHEMGDVALELGRDAQLFVAALSPRRVFVHAGVVGWNGRAIVIPGRSHSGKTSLVAALVAAGATYYSDEYAVFDEKGRVHPYPVALNVRREGALLPTRVRPEELGGRQGQRPLPVGLVVVSQFKDGSRWRPRTLTPGESVLALMQNTVPARLRPAQALAALGRAAAGVTTLKSARGEAAETVAQLVPQLGERIRQREEA
jgi:hypothetical protein